MTESKNPARWVGTGGHNFSVGRDGRAPIAIVQHVMQGTLDGTIQAFSDPLHVASAHFGVGKSGDLVQFVAVEDEAWANGNVRRPNLAAVPWIGQGKINPNLLTISIEWEGAHIGGVWVDVLWQGATLQTLRQNPGPTSFWTPTQEQYQAGLRLNKWLAATYNIVLDRQHICRHSDFDSVEKWFCPGPSFRLRRLITDLGGQV